jgi:hypothetical protein
MRICSVPGCTSKHKARGYCSAHWNRLCRYGTLFARIASPGDHQAFLDFAMTYDGNDCLIWPYGTTTKFRYGAVDGDYAHRVICERTYGPAPEGKRYAIHACDTPLCICKRHLRWGSQAENMADMVQRRRHWRHSIQPKSEPGS